MDVTCNVIDDLIPLYADGICSEDTKTIIEHHIAVCPECREKLEAMTATLEKNEKKAEIDNPFKKVKRHYLRLVTVTLLVCAIFIVPLGTAWFLKTNEVYDAGYSWATVTTNAKLRKIGNLFKKGKYREALDLFEPYCGSDDYTEEEIEVFKDWFAKRFEDVYYTNL
ncbi:MAG: zf-HC2 domain-containing protein, partial [Oscillospiraceae bacterium]|nr:zf-HC2 domain-containing protein [Oscillospiraceae bacterium]